MIEILIDHLWIPGVPRPKGSMRPVGNRYGRGPVRMIEDIDGSGAWRTTVYNAVQRAIRVPCTGVVHANEIDGAPCPGWSLPAGLPFPDAVAVKALFVFERTAQLAANPEWPVGKQGDLDKLCRNVGDALEDAGLIKNDSLITHWDAVKRFRTDPVGRKVFGRVVDGPGVMLTVDADGSMVLA